jgi:hypothetical protein
MENKRKPIRFKKGTSGNPKGRPKGSRNKANAELHAILDKYVDFDRLIKALARKAYRGNEQCAKLLLEHRYGKPAQKLDLTSGGEKIVAPVFVMPAFNNAVVLPPDEKGKHG